MPSYGARGCGYIPLRVITETRGGVCVRGDIASEEGGEGIVVGGCWVMWMSIARAVTPACTRVRERENCGVGPSVGQLPDYWA